MRTRVLTVRYAGALLVVASLLVAGQIAVQRSLEHQEGDARVINLAGRQRMLSQRLCMLLLALEAGRAEPAARSWDELRRTTAEWERAHAALLAGRPETGLHAGNSRQVVEMFASLAPAYLAMVAAARGALAWPFGAAPRAAALAALTHQEQYLAGMDRIVGQYEREARRHLEALRRRELALLALALLVLLLEGVFVFRPAVAALRARLAERELATRALAETVRLERELLRMSDREQVRIAQDLHDGLGQQLVGIRFAVSALRRELQDGPHALRVAEISTLLAEALEQTRDLVRGLHSPTLEAAGLAAALGELAVHAERRFAVPCHVSAAAAAERELPAASLTHLHRIAREATFNAARHASATRIEIELARDATELTLAVRDNGIGIKDAAGGGLGLQLMAYRARMLGASLRIAPAPRGGTTVTCCLPLSAAARAEVP
jgi:signal transduction histidine kinase